jgi:hypothetical protein
MRDAPEIVIVGSVLKWVREHPSYFFHSGVPTVEVLVEQLVAGARALGALTVEVEQFEDWFIFAAAEDWFSRARFPVPETFEFHVLPAFPELGDNCVRPECLVAAFARDVVVRSPSSVRIVNGSVECKALVGRVAEVSAWSRAIAFRGVGDT